MDRTKTVESLIQDFVNKKKKVLDRKPTKSSTENTHETNKGDSIK